MTEKGWFKTSLRPQGDRTLAEQMIGLDHALEEANGKSVLDLGCAEGCISREFALAGAIDVHGIESLQRHVDIAVQICADAPRCRFTVAYLQNYVPEHPEPTRYDIVLMLGILHKMQEPIKLLDWACRATKDLLLFRGPGRESLRTGDAIIAKHSQAKIYVAKELHNRDFKLERVVHGVRHESVEYWRRMKQ